MVSVYNLKPAFQRLLQPILSLLVYAGVRPNQITIAAILLSILGGAMVCLSSHDPKWLLSIPIVLFLRMALNALDGMLARGYQQSTPLGEILNELGDVVSDIVLYLPFVMLVALSPIKVFSFLAFVFLAVLCEFCGVLAKAMTGVRRYDGPMGKSDRALAMGVYSMALYFLPALVLWTTPLYGFLSLLLVISCLNRLRAILSMAQPTTPEGSLQ